MTNYNYSRPPDISKYMNFSVPYSYKQHTYIDLPKEDYREVRSDKSLLEQFDSKDLRKYQRIVGKILRERASIKRRRCEHLEQGWREFANFMAGVAWAMGCRATLRISKNHPAIGKKPASGECWYPVEIAFAFNNMKERAIEFGLPPIASNPLAWWGMDALYREEDMKCVHQCLGLSPVKDSDKIPF